MTPLSLDPGTHLCANVLDALADVHGSEQALRQIDAFRRVLVGPGIFSVNLNVTTADAPRNEIRLRRVYSSNADLWPVSGGKRKTRTAWTETLFVHHRPFVAAGEEVLERTFDDYGQMRPLGLNAVINVPICAGDVCYATMNVFGTRGRWQAHEVVAARLLALAVARWVAPAPDLQYTFDPA